MTVTLLSLADRGSDEILAIFEVRQDANVHKEQFLLSAVQVADLGLRVGKGDCETYDRAEYAAKEHAAMKRALNILGYGSCSERMLVRKLTMKGIEREMAENTVAELCRRGFLDSTEGAIRETERCLAKQWGRRRIVAALYSKGYSDEMVRSAMEYLEESNVDEVELCADRIRRTVRELPTDPYARRKLMASLERYGFSLSQIKEAFARIYS